MPAPLYSRYLRHFDRDTKELKKISPKTLRIIRQAKNKPALYSLSENASYEVGSFSLLPPPVLLSTLNDLYLPHEPLWVEMDWWRVMEALTAGGVPTGFPEKEQHPVRAGFLVQIGTDSRPESSVTIAAHQYLLYGNGKTYLPPVLYTLEARMTETSNKYWHGPTVPKIKQELNYDILKVGLGSPYLALYEGEHKKAMDELQFRLDALPLHMQKTVREVPFTMEDMREFIYGNNGTSRILLAALAALIAARSKRYIREEIATKPRKQGGHGKPVTEVNVYLKDTVRSGYTLKKQFRKGLGVKKGLHDVDAHWAYRKRKDGGDPRECPTSPTGVHDWEEVPDTRSQVCLICMQKRWFRKAHSRGDEAYGISPKKVKNVKVGG